MLLELTKEGDYAVRAMLALAAHDPEEPLSRTRIAAEWRIPAGFLAHALRKLVDAGLVVPIVGRAGGYRLSRDAGTISLLDVVSAVEGLPAGDRCVLRGGPCHPDGTCYVHDAFAEARARYLEVLARSTLASVLGGRASTPAGS